MKFIKINAYIISVLLISTNANAVLPYQTPYEIQEFLEKILTLARNNDLRNVDFTRKLLGAKIQANANEYLVFEKGNDLSDLFPNGETGFHFSRLSYYYQLRPFRMLMLSLPPADPRYAMFEVNDIEERFCIRGSDIEWLTVNHPQLISEDKYQPYIFNLGNDPKQKTTVSFIGPINSQQLGCLESIVVTQSSKN